MQVNLKWKVKRVAVGPDILVGYAGKHRLFTVVIGTGRASQYKVKSILLDKEEVVSSEKEGQEKAQKILNQWLQDLLA